MKTVEDIHWLSRNPGLASVFAAIAKVGEANAEQIRKQVRIEQLVEGYILDLVVRGLVIEGKKGYELTEEGRRVFESVADML